MRPMRHNAEPRRTRRATTLERQHFAELSQPMMDYVRANSAGSDDYFSTVNIISTLMTMGATLIHECRRFGYVPSSRGLLVYDDPAQESLGTPLTEAQEENIISALEELYGRLMRKP